MDLQTILSAVESWPVEDRLRLIEGVWDGLDAASQASELTEAQTVDLQRRLHTYRENSKAGSPWEDVKARLQGSGR